jgi:hypothetical protein
MLCGIPYTIDEIKIPRTVQGQYPHRDYNDGAEPF